MLDKQVEQVQGKLAAVASGGEAVSQAGRQLGAEVPVEVVRKVSAVLVDGVEVLKGSI
jgi:hypothetical protein